MIQFITSSIALNFRHLTASEDAAANETLLQYADGNETPNAQAD
jgi:hypothetical protein